MHRVPIRAALERMDLYFIDPSPAMRAGDRRQWKASPVLPFNPVWLGLVILLMSIGAHMVAGRPDHRAEIVGRL